MGYIVKKFYADDFAGFREVIPQHLLQTGKKYTTKIEQNNGRTRHWLARFRRRTLVVSKCPKMVEITLQLLAVFRFYESFDTFTEMFCTSPLFN